MSVLQMTVDEQQYQLSSIDERLSAGLKREIVSPEEFEVLVNIYENVIYMVGPKEDGTYDEYMYLADKNKFELIGTTSSVDLNGYLPLTGGEMSGDIKIKNIYASEYSTDTFSATYGESGLIMSYSTDDPSLPAQSKITLGTGNHPTIMVYGKNEAD
jgi:hypothetical protein